MAFIMKFAPSISLLSIVCLYTLSGVAAGMTCEEVLGVPYSCPLPFQDEAKAYCCYNKDMPYCCNLPDYVVNNTAIIAGVVVAGVLMLLLCTICSCCCCSCCFLAKRRQQRGTVLFGPVATTQPTTFYSAQAMYPVQPTAHSPPPLTSYPPDSQLPYNPGFVSKH